MVSDGISGYSLYGGTLHVSVGPEFWDILYKLIVLEQSKSTSLWWRKLSKLEGSKYTKHQPRRRHFYLTLLKCVNFYITLLKYLSKITICKILVWWVIKIKLHRKLRIEIKRQNKMNLDISLLCAYVFSASRKENVCRQFYKDTIIFINRIATQVP